MEKERESVSFPLFYQVKEGTVRMQVQMALAQASLRLDTKPSEEELPVFIYDAS